jgi:hypothetical protein
MTTRGFEHPCNVLACKDKTRSFYGKYKKIHNYMMNGTCHNEEYREMLIEDKIAQNLPKQFCKVFFKLMDSFMNNIPCFNPPHSWDFMNLKDDVYHTASYNDSSASDDIKLIKKIIMEEEGVEKNVLNPFAGHDPILHYTKELAEGCNRVKCAN